MKTLITGFFLGVLCPCLSAAEHNLFLSSQAQWIHRDIKADEDNNPDNRIFRLAENSAKVELRPTLESNWDRLSLSLDPRLQYRVNRNEFGREDFTDLELRYWRAEVVVDSFSASAGQYVVLWGPSVIFSPSNRYHLDNGRTDPHSELIAREFIEADWYLGVHWYLEFIANIGAGKQELADFSPSGDIRLNWMGDSISATLQGSYLNPGWGWGGLLQWTVNDAWIVYADSLYAPFPSTQTFFQEPKPVSERRRLKAVAGLSYTFRKGLNVALDYYYNGLGRDRHDSTTLLQQSIERTADLVQGTGDDGDIGFIQSLNRQPFFTLSKRYAVARLSHNQLLGGISASYIAIQNLDDRARQHVLTFDYDAGKSLSLFATLNVFSGDSLTEFGRFFNSQVSVGLRWVLL